MHALRLVASSADDRSALVHVVRSVAAHPSGFAVYVHALLPPAAPSQSVRLEAQYSQSPATWHDDSRAARVVAVRSAPLQTLASAAAHASVSG